MSVILRFSGGTHTDNQTHTHMYRETDKYIYTWIINHFNNLGDYGILFCAGKSIYHTIICILNTNFIFNYLQTIRIYDAIHE